MKMLVLEPRTPNHDHSDESLARLLIVPVTVMLQQHVRALANALEAAHQVTPDITSLTSMKRHAHLIVPNRARGAQLRRTISSITERVHAHGVAGFDACLLPKEDLYALRDENGAVAGMTINYHGTNAPTLSWRGYQAGLTQPLLTWTAYPADTKDILQ